VKASIAAERLLVYEVGEGWAPLSAVLGVPPPTTPLPRENTTDTFETRKAEAARANRGRRIFHQASLRRRRQCGGLQFGNPPYARPRRS
jgi:hypothetical protein